MLPALSSKTSVMSGNDGLQSSGSSADERGIVTCDAACFKPTRVDNDLRIG